MSYSNTGLLSLDVCVGLLGRYDRGREYLAYQAGLKTKVLDEIPPQDDIEAGMILLVVNKRDQSVIDQLTVSWRLWEGLAGAGGNPRKNKFGEVKEEVSNFNTELSDAIKSALNEVENLYVHEECATEWTDTHSCEVDNECPACGCDCTPVRSDWLAVADEKDGVWRYYRSNGAGDKNEFTTKLVVNI